MKFLKKGVSVSGEWESETHIKSKSVGEVLCAGIHWNMIEK